MPTSQGYIPHECLQAGDVIGDLVAGGKPKLWPKIRNALQGLFYASAIRRLYKGA